MVRWRTKDLYTGPKFAGVRALMKAGGLCDGDFDKPMIGIHNTYGEGGPGHINLNAITQEVRAGIYQAGGVPIEFGGPCHCPAHNPDENDVPQRDIIAMSVENFIELHLLDGLVCVGSCDKPNPGHWLAAARLRHIPVIMALGGPSLLGGIFQGKRINANFAIQAGFKYDMDPKSISLEDVCEIENLACPGPGSCAPCGTANTTAILSEVLGLTLPGGGTAPAVSAKRRWLSRQTGHRIVAMVREGLMPSAILTHQALENAIIILHAIGGSSNAIFHILSLAEELQMGDQINVDLIEDLGKKIPCIADILPGGEYGVTDLDEVGGIQAVMKRLETFLHKDALTVNAKTVRENLIGVKLIETSIIRSIDNPVFERGLTVVKGNLATSGIVRFSVFPKNLLKYSGPAKVFESRHEAQEAVKTGTIRRGDVVVVRYEGPRGGPGMPDLLHLNYEMRAANLTEYCPLITDGKFSGFSQGGYICQVSPEAATGGPIALIRDNDQIEIDILNNKVNARLSDDELNKRRSEWKAKEPKVKRGYLTLWARFANPASKGAGLPYNI